MLVSDLNSMLKRPDLPIVNVGKLCLVPLSFRLLIRLYLNGLSGRAFQLASGQNQKAAPGQIIISELGKYPPGGHGKFEAQ